MNKSLDKPEKREIMDEYRDANPTKRLHFYMQHRELRSEFAQIEQNERKEILNFKNKKRRRKWKNR